MKLSKVKKICTDAGQLCVLDGLVRPVSNDMANHLMACVRSVAERHVVERVEE